MPAINLRDYVREIEKQVEGKRYDEAIAHSHYLLQTYPKCVDVYRLLGKAFLEVQRYGDAADIFQRVLSAIPDDFVAHVGMSIIREDEGNLDEAIWHMERAFDVQPSNSAIQEELRRMYGRRDNIEPPKIRLTRGALARMYYKGELYPQAIAETRAALTENPDRLDLQAILAEIYRNAGQKIEAADIANQILHKLPYCKIANQILYEVLSGTDRDGEAKTYLLRLAQLDPYYNQLSSSYPTVQAVPDAAIRLEKLDWKVSQTTAAKKDQPLWAASLGVDLGEQASSGSESLPDWLIESQEIASPTASAGEEAVVPAFISDMESDLDMQESDTGEAASVGDDQIPDWMKELGWTPAGAQSQAAEAGYKFEEDLGKEAVEGGLAAAELPDWLQAISPSDITGVPANDKVDPWLENLFAGSTGTVETTAKPSPEPQPERELPDWLNELGGPSVSGPTAGESQAPKSTTEIPDWLKEPGAQEPGKSTELPDWLSEGQAPAEDSDDALPDWLLASEPAQTVESGAAMTGDPPAENLPQPGEELPAWLFTAETADQGTPVGDKKPAGPAEPPEAAPGGEMPDWLIEIGMAGDTIESAAPAAEPSAEMEAKPMTEAGLPDWLNEIGAQVESGEASPASEAELPDWLVAHLPSLENETAAPAAEEKLPEWVSEIAPPEQVEEPFPAAEEGLPAWLAPSETRAEEAAVTEEAALPSWLTEIEPTAEAEETTPAGEGSLPAWLTEAETQAEAEEAAPAAEGKLPAWLLELEGKKEPEEGATATEAGLPAWLIEGEPAAEAGEGTPAVKAELPTWLTEIEEAAPTAEAEASAARVEAELPDWIPETEKAQAEEEAPAVEAELPAWLIEGEPAVEAQETPAVEAELPAWLTEAEEVKAAEETLPAWLMEGEAAVEAEEGTPALEGELPAWLTAVEEAKAEEETPAAEETLPAWLMEGEAAVEAEESTPALEGELPAWLTAAEEAKAEEETPAAEETLPAWLMEGEAAVEAEESAPAVETELPAWLSEIEGTNAEEAMPAAEEELPAWLMDEEPGVTAEQILPADEEELPAWVLEDKITAEAGEAALPAEAQFPDWAATAEQTPEAAEALQAEERLPAWLLDDKQATEIEEAVPAAKEELSAGPIELQTSHEEAPEQPPAVPEAEPIAVDLGDTKPTRVAQPASADELADAFAWLVAMLTPTEAAPEPAVDEVKAPAPESAAPSSSAPGEFGAFPMDEDAAFAWLESLAVKQGASEALLLTPEERQETPPEWVQQAAAEAMVETAAESQIALSEPSAVEPPAPMPSEPGAFSLDDDAAFAWLESLAVQQGASEALLLTPEERQVAPPEWVQQVAAEAAVAETAPVEQDAPAAAEVVTPEETRAAEETMAMEEAQAAEEAAPGETPLMTASAAKEDIPDLPDWLAGGDYESHEEQLEWRPPVITRRRYDVNQASLIELERLPGIGFIMAQRIVDYREQHGRFNQVEELLNIPDFTTYTLEGLRENLYVIPVEHRPAPVIGPRLPGTEVALPVEEKKPAQAQPAPEPVRQARELAAGGEWEQALAAYNRLIQTNQHLALVINDLVEAGREKAGDFELWQSLGDAYLRANQLKEAMQAYTKAEKLLG